MSKMSKVEWELASLMNESEWEIAKREHKYNLLLEKYERLEKRLAEHEPRFDVDGLSYMWDDAYFNRR